MTTWTWLAAGLLLAACAGNSRRSGSVPAVRGTVTYRERMALPADAEVEVQLFDVSRQDSAATPIADTVVRPAGRQVPLPFELRYDPDRIDRRHVYALRAGIRSGGSLLFTTTSVVKVITWDHPHVVDLVLTRVGGAASAAPAAADSTGLWGSAWLLEDLAGSGVIDHAEATLEFPERGRVTGRGSCNRFFGPAEVTDSTITFGPLGATMMACPEAIMNQEGRYFRALEGTVGYRMEGSALLLTGKGMAKPLRFSRKGP